MNKVVIQDLLNDHYDIVPTDISKMEGYDSLNYRISANDSRYTLKIYKYTDHSYQDVQAENYMIQSLAHIKYDLPSPVKNAEGDKLTVIKEKGVFFRLLSYVDGTFLSDFSCTKDTAKDLGVFLGKLDTELLQIRNANIESRKLNWDLHYMLNSEAFIDDIKDPIKKKIVAYFLLQWKTFIIEKLPHLRKSIIHNDANDHNVLLTNGKISGIIDFGDMVHSYLINELAIAASYLAMDIEDPIGLIASLVKGYNEVLPLQRVEIEVLYYFIAGRLCTSVLNSTHSKLEKPDSDYITISEQGAWDLLEKWITINPLSVKKKWLKAANLEIAKSELHLRKRRDLYTPKALSLSYKRPFHMTGAAFQYMYDGEGHAILDAYNNIIQVGHCHPRVVAAGQKAMARLNTNTRYLYEDLPRYSEHLLSHFPDHLNKVFLVNSGSAASDLATRLAQTHTGNRKMVIVEHGYHGNTKMSIDISHYKYGHKGGQGKEDHIIQVPMPDAYRGPHRGGDAGTQYAQEVNQILSQQANEDIGAFIAEPIIGCGGQVPLAKGYLSQVYPQIRKEGGLCISDEVQTGFGRLGKWFWGFEMHEVVPDIVILGKPIGNGHPMAAVVTTSKIAESFNNGMEFFSSFGGNPVSCAIGDAVLSVIEEEGLQQNATSVGAHLTNLISDLQSDHPCIGDVRGEGLFLGVDIVKDPITRSPDEPLARHIVNSLREKNILTSIDGPHHNVIKIKPPLCFNQNNAERLVDELKLILG